MTIAQGRTGHWACANTVSLHTAVDLRTCVGIIAGGSIRLGDLDADPGQWITA